MMVSSGRHDRTSPVLSCIRAMALTAALSGWAALPAHASLHAAGTDRIRIEVQMPIENGDVATATGAARHEAIRRAVDKAIRTRVDQSAPTASIEKILKGILDDPEAYAELKLLDEQVIGTNVELQAEVSVDRGRIGRTIADAGLARKWRVMIVIPEWHLERPVPDPAAETEFIRQFVQAGFKVIDQARYQELRFQAADRLRDAGAAAEIARSMGADVIITGEAFSQRGSDAMGLVSCQARVEVRAILADTAEIIAADAAEGGGAGNAEAVAAKKALQTTAGKLAPLFIEDLRLLPGARARSLQVEVGLFAALRDAASFQKALEGLAGIARVTRESYVEGMLTLEVEVDSMTAETLAEGFESNAEFKPYRLAVQEASKTKIRAKVQGRSQ